MNPPSFEQQVTFLRCRDIEASAAFYAGILGLEMVLDQGACRIFRVAGPAFIGLCLAGERPIASEGVIFTLVTQDVDGWHAHLEAQGVTLEGRPAVNPHHHIYHFFARDPDGHLLEVQRFLDPDWPAVP